MLLNIISLISFYRFELDTNFLSFFSGGNPKAEEFEQLSKKYQSGDIISILVEDDDKSLLTEENLVAICNMRESLTTIDGVAQVQTFVPSQVIVDGSTISLDEQVIRSRYGDIADFIETKYYLTENFLAADQQTGMILVTMDIDADASEVLDRIEDTTADQTSFDISLAGDEVIQETLMDYLIRILITLIPCVVILIIVIFYIFLRNRLLTLAALQPAGFAALWIFGTLFWSGREISIVTVITPIFIFVIGSAYGLHYASHFAENIETIPDQRKRTIETLRIAGIPILISAATTMAGFISLVWTDVVPMRDMGIFVTLGIGYAGLNSLLYTPALLSRSNPTPRKSLFRENSLGRWIMKVPWIVVVVVFVAILGISIAYIPKLNVVSDQLMYFKDDSSIRQTFDKVEQNFGDPSPLIAEVTVTDGVNQLTNQQLASEVLSLEREMETLPGIVKVISIFDMIAGYNEMVTGEEGYPESPAAIQAITAGIGSMDEWLSDDGIRLTVRTKNYGSDEVDAMEEFVDSSEILHTVAGMPILFEEMNTLVVDSQLRSLGLAAVLIFIMLLITFRKVRDSLLGLVPVIIGTLAVLGAISLFGFNLNIMTATLSAICIGIGIDYAVHVISGIHYFQSDTTSYEEATRLTINSVSKPILGNALAIAVGLSVLFFSPLKLHFQVASIMWVAMVVSCMAALLLLPILLSISRRGRGSDS